MSSYNNIRKIRYTKTPLDIVSLREYIIFEDSHAHEKYVVFKFSNNVNQRLLGFKFEVLQYNKDNELLEKSTVLHENFVAEANDLFVPNAKLKINFECESLEVKLESASFDRVRWSDGEFKDNSYSFGAYAEKVAKPIAVKPTVVAADTDRTTEKKKNKNKLPFTISNISRRNKAVFPAVFNVILCVIVIGLVVFSTFYFKSSTGYFVVDKFILEESSSGYVSIIEYTGDDENLVIPATLDDNYVIKIAKGAFKNSSIKSITFESQKELVIETGAFSDCSKLNAVASAGNGEIIVMEGAFKNCTSLTTFIVPDAYLMQKCFDGTYNISYLVIDGVLFDVNTGRLVDIFNDRSYITLLSFKMNMDYPASFLENVQF